MNKADRARELTAQATQELQASLERGHSDQLQAYLRAMAQFHDYSFGNVMLIVQQRPTATRVAGYKTWQKLGRQVRKGEKGIVIIAPMVFKRRPADTNTDDEHAIGFRATHVFDVAQTDGEPLPEPGQVTGDPQQHTDRLTTLVRSAGVTLRYATADELGGAEGVAQGGTMLLQRDLAPAHAFSVLVHEFAHELLHHSGETRRPSKTVRETEAEAVAYIVGHAIGLENGTAATDYIQLYEGDVKTLTASLNRIQKAATRILTGLLNEE